MYCTDIVEYTIFAGLIPSHIILFGGEGHTSLCVSSYTDILTKSKCTL
jgi:hypothetical protein